MSVISIVAASVTVVLIVAGAAIGILLKQARNNGRFEQHFLDIDNRMVSLEKQVKDGGMVEQHLINIDKKIDSLDKNISGIWKKVSESAEDIAAIKGN